MHDTTAHPVPGPSSARAARFKPSLAVAVLAAVAVLTVACGGGSPSAAGSSGTGQGLLAQSLAFAHCMRSHGAPNYPDPNSSGVFMVNPSNNARFQAPQSTRAACDHLLPRKGNKTLGPPTAAQQRRALAFAGCMRRHGFPKFPDGWSGNIGQLISAGIDPHSPQLNAALTKCGF